MNFNISWRTWVCALAIMMISAALPDTLRAQRVFSAVVADSLTHEPLAGVNAILFNADSSFIKGTSTDTTGTFRISVPSRSAHYVRISMIGYKNTFVSLPKLRANDKDKRDTVFLALNEVVLQGAVVVGTRPDVEIKEDTTAFNAEEYKVPEGEALEELIKLLPGVEVDGTTITYNGKTISEFKVNGKDFFKGNRRIALKNLPVELVKKIKAYEKKSDYAEQTGIDDGNEQTVMDIELKKELNETWTTNYDAGVGSYGRYINKLFANRITDNSRLTLTGNAQNDDARSDNKSFGADFNVNNGKKRDENGRFEIGGNLHGNNNHSHSESWRAAENYTGTSGTSQFSNSNNYNKDRSSGIGGHLRMEWHPDTLTTVTASNNLGFNNSRSYARSLSARFNSDPYEYTPESNPLDSVFSDRFSTNMMPGLYGATINRNSTRRKSRNHSYNYSLHAMMVRRLNSKGRNFSIDLDMSTGNNDGKSYRISDINYYKRSENNNHTYTNQYNVSDSHSWSYQWRMSYSEPLAKGLHLQLNYSFGRSRSRTAPTLYELDSLENWRDGNRELGEIPSTRDSLEAVINYDNTSRQLTDNFNHGWTVGLNYNSKKINSFLATGISYNTSHLDYMRGDVDTVLKRHLLRFAPRTMFRYRFTKNERIEFRYNGRTSDPSLQSKIRIVDSSDPLNIRISGADLKPAWHNEFKLSYNKFIEKRQQTWEVNTEFHQSLNNSSTAVSYDENTGVRTTQNKNINGNWDGNANFVFATGFGPKKRFRFRSGTALNYDHSVGYISTGSTSDSEKNTTQTTGVTERLTFTYRTENFEARLQGALRYRHTDNKLRPQSNMDTYNYSYSGSVRAHLPWKMTLETSLRMQSRRGYASSAMNTDELLWNATISQSFFRGAPLILRLRCNDILHNQSNITRTINAQSRVDSETDASYSYVMLHVILRINIFNGKITSGFGKGGSKKRQPGEAGRRARK